MFTVKILKYYIIIIFIQRFSVFVDCDETIILLVTDILCYSNYLFSNSTWQGPFVYMIKAQSNFFQYSVFLSVDSQAIFLLHYY